MAQLSSQLVQQWLMIVKGTAGQIQQQVQAQNQTQAPPPSEVQAVQTMVPKLEDDKAVASEEAVTAEEVNKIVAKEEINNENESDAISTGTFYKTSGKDGKLLIRKSSQDSKDENEDISDDSEKSEDRKSDNEKERSKMKSSKISNKAKNKERNEKKSEKENDHEKDKDRERDKEKDKKKSSHSSSSKNSSSSSSRHKTSSRSRDDKDRHRDKGKDKDRDKSKDTDKDKQKMNGALKSSSSKSGKDKKDHREREKDKGKTEEKDKEKQTEKDNSTLEKLKPPTIEKLGRIPKKVVPVEEKSNDGLESKKKAFSVGIRKDKENEERPKTVKVFNSKMRSTGLEEEVKPAPPRSATANKKPTPSVQLPTIPQKRPSPPKDIRDPILPPEKKLKLDKIDVPERPGAIKLIPPKPKRKFSELLLFIFILFLQVPSTSRRKFPAATLQHLAGACFSSFLPIVFTRRKTTEFHGFFYFSSLLY